MANTIKLGNGNWATKEGSLLAYNDENNNFKPLPFTTTRASSATVVNKQGLIETVGSGIPRIDFSDDANGALLLENSATNLITYSEAFDNAYWTKSGSSVTSGSASPKGDASAFKLVEGTNTGGHYIYSSSISVGASANHNGSIFVKSSGRTKIGIRDRGYSATYATFDLTTKTVLDSSGITAVIIALSNDWYKIDYTYQSSASSLSVLALYLLDDSYTSADPSSLSYIGDGTSGVYIYGAQLEQNSYASSYIKNEGTALGVTRVADTASGSGNSTVINSTEGTLYYEGSALANDETNRQISISNGTSSQRVYFGFKTTDNEIIMSSNNVISGSYNSVTHVLNNATLNNKFAFKYKENDFTLFVNGIKIGTVTSGVVPIGLSILDFNNGGGSSTFYGKTKSVQVYTTALTDAELTTLTTI